MLQAFSDSEIASEIRSGRDHAASRLDVASEDFRVRKALWIELFFSLSETLSSGRDRHGNWPVTVALITPIAPTGSRFNENAEVCRQASARQTATLSKKLY